MTLPVFVFVCVLSPSVTQGRLTHLRPEALMYFLLHVLQV